MISIILPTYNSITFLKERVDTILSQTISDWECIVIDGESIDGTWEYLKVIANKNNRFKMFQYPPKGVYNAWNIGVKKSKGDFIYFATSDDTMTSNCLEELLKGFKFAPNSSFAHCCLSIIDNNSDEIKEMNWKSFPAQQYFGELTARYHIRKAPLIGILYVTHQTIIHSFTQVLIRKSIFDKCGFFLENYGPKADLEWGMRIGLTEDSIHIPMTLATWRVHKNQLTTNETSFKSRYELLNLINLAIENAKCSTIIKEKKNLCLGWGLNKLVSELTFLEKIQKISFYKVIWFKLFEKEFVEALVSKEKYQFFLQKKMKIRDKELIDSI